MKAKFKEALKKSHKQVLEKKWKWKLLSCVWLFASPWTLQAKMLEWIARGSSQPRDWTQVFPIAGELFTSWATGEPQDYWSG